MLFYGTASRILKDQTVVSVMGNHDIGNGEGDYGKLQNRWFTYTEERWIVSTLTRPIIQVIRVGNTTTTMWIAMILIATANG